MLRRLYIKNLVLVDTCEIEFQPGFNVITGETGAGKSIILSSLSLLLGQRQDSSLIRQGASSAIVEATFDALSVHDLLLDAGISHNVEDEVVIRRELSLSGKSRVFLNDQTVQLTLLKKLAPHLLEISTQHGHIELLQDDAPLTLLDRYADLEEAKSTFQNTYHRVQTLLKAINQFTQQEAARHRQIETCRREIEEIEKTNPQPQEDDELFAEYSKLSGLADAAATISEILIPLDQDESSTLSQLARIKHSIERLAHKNSTYSTIKETFKRAVCDLQDVAFELTRSLEESTQAQETYLQLEERLNSLHALKKKYGPTLADVLAWKEKQQSLLTKLEAEGISLDTLQEELLLVQEEATSQAQILTEKRQRAARKLSTAITNELVELNMPHALFEVVIRSVARKLTGDDEIEFYLTPNRGEPPVNVQKGISGGELARLLLALKCVMVGKNPVGSILFDEIDANIGGQTASIVGKKLQQLGKECQVIAVTHFAQVARCANSHFCIQKREENSRTTTHIQLLDSPPLRQQEITRMLGGNEADIAIILQSA